MRMQQSRRFAVAGVVVLGCMVGFVAMAQAQSKRKSSPAAAAGGPVPAGAYRVDSVHSSVIFKIKHMGVANFYGRINSAAGSFELKDGGALDIKIDMNSINSGNEKRDQHLKSPDFFSVKEFPEASFKSTSMKKTGDNTYEAEGLMTLHGVTKTLAAKIEMTGSGKGMKGPAQGMESKVTIRRSDYSIGAAGPLGDDVELIVSLEGGQ